MGGGSAARKRQFWLPKMGNFFRKAGSLACRWIKDTAVPAAADACRAAWRTIQPPAAWSKWYQAWAQKWCRGLRCGLCDFAAPALLVAFAATGLTVWPLASAAFICLLVGAGIDLVDLWLGPPLELGQALLRLCMLGLNIAAGVMQLVNVGADHWWQLAAISSGFGIAKALVQLLASWCAGEASTKMWAAFFPEAIASTLEWVGLSAAPAAGAWFIGVANCLRPAALFGLFKRVCDKWGGSPKLAP